MEAAAAGSSEGAAIVVCKTLDVSSEGLRVAVPQALTVGAFLQIGVDHPGEPEIETFLPGGRSALVHPGETARITPGLQVSSCYRRSTRTSIAGRKLINDMDSEP